MKPMKQALFIINRLQKYFCLLLGICVLLSSCSTDENVQLYNQPLNFTFGTIEEVKASSRAYEAYTGNEFGVYAKLYRPEYTPTGTLGESFMNNEKVIYNGSYCETSKSYYWADGDTHFAAYSPYTNTPGTADLNVKLPEIPYAGYSYSGVVDGYTDYMYSDEQMGGYEDFMDGSVPIIFHHALAKVDFSVRLSKAQEGSTKWSIDLVSLKLNNIRYKGDVNFTHGNGINGWTSNANEVWNTQSFPLGAVYDNDFLCDMSVGNVSLHIDNTVEHNIGNTLYLMPQLLYANGESEYVQALTVEYKLHTIKGDNTKTTDYTVTVPVRTESIPKWQINQYIKYKLVLEPGASMELVVEAQPWESVEFTNEFSNTVTVNNEEKIAWTEGTYARIDDDKVVLLDEITTPAEFSFNIAGPLGGTWKAFFITKTGSSDAFILSQSEGPVGTPCTVKIKANTENTSNVANTAELCFVVIQGSSILPVDVLTNLSGERNYTIVQNINK